MAVPRAPACTHRTAVLSALAYGPAKRTSPMLRVSAYFNPIDVVKREAGLQSNKLPAVLRERVEMAVEQQGCRVTVGDVAARAGVKVQEAEQALQALAYDAKATLEVSNEGTIVYTFPRFFRSDVAARSVLLRLRPVWLAAQRATAYLARVMFGTALVASIFLVWLAVMVVLSGKGDRDRNDRGGGGGHYGHGMRMFFDLTDLLIYLDPNYGVSAQKRRGESQLTFVEAIFSFVFGDGDPNAGYDDARWSALGQLIQDRGGVVTAEEMAPYLDPPLPTGAEDSAGDEWDAAAQATSRRGAPTPGAAGPAYADESFVLPALIRFGGEPVVDDATGGLLYRFPAFQASAQRAGLRVSRPVDLPLEEGWELTAASGGQLAATVGLGGLNLAGVATLSGLLADTHARYVLMANGLGWVGGLMPALQLYAAAFFAIPALRWFINSQRNLKIEKRNDARTAAARIVNGPGKWVRQKLQAARKQGEKRTLGAQDMVFTTEKEAAPQMNVNQMDDWDRRLRSSTSTKDGRQRDAGDGAGSGW